MSDAARKRTVHLWSLCEDVVVEPGEDENELVLTGSLGSERIDSSHPVVHEALRRMEMGPVLLANLEPPSGGAETRARMYLVLMPLLERLSHLIVRTLGIDDLGGPLLSVLPVARPASFALVRLSRWQAVRLPRDVSLTLAPEGFVLEWSGSPYRVVMHRPEVAWVVGMLAWPVTPDDVSGMLALSPGVAESILEYLAAAGMTAQADAPTRSRAVCPPGTL
jgi:hypothetical protein